MTIDTQKLRDEPYLRDGIETRRIMVEAADVIDANAAEIVRLRVALAQQPSAQDHEDAERVRNAAGVLDTLTSNLSNDHPLRVEATSCAKRAVADLYRIADQIDAAPSAKEPDHA